MSWKDTLREDAKRYLLINYTLRFHKGIKEVTNLTEREESGGFCETCYYTDILTVIDFIDDEGNVDQTEVYMNLAKFMREVADV